MGCARITEISATLGEFQASQLQISLTQAMKTHLHLALLLALSLSALSQQPSTSPTQQQSNAASANKDTSATSGDQITKPAGAKGATLIGCLEGPGTDGKYMVRNMAHR